MLNRCRCWFVTAVDVKGRYVVTENCGEGHRLRIVISSGFVSGSRLTGSEMIGAMTVPLLRTLASLRIPPFVNVF